MRIDQARKQHGIAKVMHFGALEVSGPQSNLRETPFLNHKCRGHQTLLRQYSG
jgi:hypothetical protein